LNATADPMDSDGFVHAPTRPGLGEDINLEYIRTNKLKEI
jgi:L-alanine-DL-glutamate epimerase-like enolase superfamily enzyme